MITILNDDATVTNLVVEMEIEWQTFPFQSKIPEEYASGRCSQERFSSMWSQLEQIYGMVYYKESPKPKLKNANSQCDYCNGSMHPSKVFANVDQCNDCHKTFVRLFG